MKRTIVFHAVITLLLTVFPFISDAAPPNAWNFTNTTDDYRGVTYGNGTYVAVGDKIMISVGGGNWVINPSNPSSGLNGVVYGINRFVAVGDNETIYTSPDGNTWTNHSLGGSYKLKGVTYGNGFFMAVGDDTSGASPKNLRIYKSTDGATWTYNQFPVPNGSFSGITYGNGRFMAIANGYYTGPGGNKLVHFTSTDSGASWTTDESTFFSTTWGVTYGNGKFIAISATNFFEFVGGVIWINRGSMGFSDLARAISYGNGYFAVIASMKEIRYSSDLSTWNLGNFTEHPLSAITYGAGGNTYFVAVGSGTSAKSNQTGNELQIHAVGDPGSGIVISNPDGVSCPSALACTPDYFDNNTVITLRAVPYDLKVPPFTRYYFTSWSGAECAGNVSLTCKVKMNADKVITANFSSTQPISETWAKIFGSSGTAYALSVKQTSDGGYIIGGTNSPGVMKLDSKGIIDWHVNNGGSSPDYAYSVQETSDGGYIAAGFTGSFGAGNFDMWLRKLNAAGSQEWQKTYGGAGNDHAYSIQETTDGGYIAAGYTNSFGAGNDDAWIIKLKSDGTVEWQKTYGSTGYDHVSSIQQTSNGGYIVAGSTNIFGIYHSWIMKLDADGTIDWQNTYAHTGADFANSIQQTFDGGYIVAGKFVSGGYNKAWVMKIMADGTVEWQKTYASLFGNDAYSIQQTSDGGYIVAGYTDSFGAGSNDIWVMKLMADGTVDWQKTYGGAGDDWILSDNSIQQTSDGGYIIAGFSNSFGTVNYDALIIKIDSSGNISGCAGLNSTGTNVNGLLFSPTITSTAVQGVPSTISPVSSTGNVTIPTNLKSQPCSGICSYLTNPLTENNIVITGGAYDMDIIPSDSTCSWSVITSYPWIAINTGSPGTGPGTVNYTVAANAGPSRAGSMTIAGDGGSTTFNLSQIGGCSISVSPKSYSFQSLGGSSSLYVYASDPSCPWTVTSDQTWVTFPGVGTGIGDGIISYTVAPNTGPARDAGILLNAVPVLSVSQSGYIADTDGDGIPDDQDNCPLVPNSPNIGTCFPVGSPRISCTNDGQCGGGLCIMDQRDSDGDGKGDVCDNCVGFFNPDQACTGPCLTDGVGDACRPDPNPENLGLAPKNSPPAAPTVTYPDSDNDGFADNVDTCFNIPNAGQTLPLCYKDLDEDRYSDGVSLPLIVTTVTKTDSSNSSSYTAKRCDCPGGYYLSRLVVSSSPLIATSGDCNDNRADIHPGAPNPPVPDGTDYDCNPNTPDLVNPFYLKFDMDAAWLPEPGKPISIAARVVDQSGNTIQPVTFSMNEPIVISRYPGQFTNDNSSPGVCSVTNGSCFYGGAPCPGGAADICQDPNPDFDPPQLSGNQISLIARDYGASIKIPITARWSSGSTNYELSRTLTVPEDTDNNGLPDAWELATFGLLNNNKDATGDDGIKNLDKYRGFKWGRLGDSVDVGQAIFGKMYQTAALVPAGGISHFRLDPLKKNLFLKYQNYDTNYPFAIGAAFRDMRVDVYALDISSVPGNGINENKIDTVTVTLDSTNSYNSEDVNILKRSVRDWTFKTLGVSGIGNGTTYGSSIVYKRVMDAYFTNKPYFDNNTYTGGTMSSPSSWTAPGSAGNLKLDPIASVENASDDGVVRRAEDVYANNRIDGDYPYPCSSCGTGVLWDYYRQLSPFNIDNNSNNIMLVELPVASNPNNIDRTREYTRFQVLKHVTTHEIGHAVGVPMTHTTEPQCLMKDSTTDWVRDGIFGPTAQGYIRIHNQ
jgi:hypothetical protein